MVIILADLEIRIQGQTGYLRADPRTHQKARKERKTGKGKKQI